MNVYPGTPLSLVGVPPSSRGQRNLNPSPISAAHGDGTLADTFYIQLLGRIARPHASLGKGTIVVKVRLALIIAAFSAMLAPAMAQDTQGLAPADEYFGHYKLSVLGIANTIRDAGSRLDAGTDPRSMLNGPLSFVTDAIKDWESQYPADPWISKDLLALETVYLRVPTDEGFRLATQTESWLVADYTSSDSASNGRTELAANRIPYMPQQIPQVAQAPAPPPQQYYTPLPPVAYAAPAPTQPAIPSYAIPWQRFASMRSPLPPPSYRYGYGY
jgi:hypothetical protein